MSNKEERYAYPVRSYKGAREDIVSLLYETSYLVCDIKPDSYYKTNERQDDGIRYIRLCINNKSIIIPININDKNNLEIIKSINQNIKKIDLTIIDRDLNDIFTPSVFYTSDNEVYITPKDLQILSMYKESFIKSKLISATTDKYIENRSKKRK